MDLVRVALARSLKPTFAGHLATRGVLDNPMALVLVETIKYSRLIFVEPLATKDE